MCSSNVQLHDKTRPSGDEQAALTKSNPAHSHRYVSIYLCMLFAFCSPLLHPPTTHPSSTSSILPRSHIQSWCSFGFLLLQLAVKILDEPFTFWPGGDILINWNSGHNLWWMSLVFSLHLKLFSTPLQTEVKLNNGIYFRDAQSNRLQAGIRWFSARSVWSIISPLGTQNVIFSQAECTRSIRPKF